MNLFSASGLCMIITSSGLKDLLIDCPIGVCFAKRGGSLQQWLQSQQTSVLALFLMADQEGTLVLLPGCRSQTAHHSCTGSALSVLCEKRTAFLCRGCNRPDVLSFKHCMQPHVLASARGLPALQAVLHLGHIGQGSGNRHVRLWPSLAHTLSACSAYARSANELYVQNRHGMPCQDST